MVKVNRIFTRQVTKNSFANWFGKSKLHVIQYTLKFEATYQQWPVFMSLRDDV